MLLNQHLLSLFEWLLYLLLLIANVLLLVLVALLVVIVYPSLFVDAIVWPKLVDLLMLVLEFLVCCSCL